ncbi:MAG: GFA family protein [Albidovulum sp.]|nr:GFA family protein [Albidovulum sp.]
MGSHGRCLCGNVSWSFTGGANSSCHCHCESCRRCTAAPFTTFVGVDKNRFTWNGDKPTRYESSPGIHRSFCGNCGTSMSFETAKLEDEIFLYAATMINPQDARPSHHIFWEEKLPWIQVGDELEKFTGFGPPLTRSLQ